MASEAVMEARRYMMEMKNCCQSTLCPFAERFDYAPEEMERMTVGFGGGMGHGDNCGAFVGGYLVLALAFGDDEEKTEEKQRASSLSRIVLSIWSLVRPLMFSRVLIQPSQKSLIASSPFTLFSPRPKFLSAHLP